MSHFKLILCYYGDFENEIFQRYIYIYIYIYIFEHFGKCFLYLFVTIKLFERSL